MNIDYANNPFNCRHVLLSVPLKQHICQKIHFTALNIAENIDTLYLNMNGYDHEGHLFHPDYIDQVYDGVTLAVFQMINRLFTSRLGRSIQTTFNVLSKMAEDVSVSPISHEAVWSICMFLRKQQMLNLEIEFDHQRTEWGIFIFTPDIYLYAEDQKKKPEIVCVLDLQKSRILAFRICLDQKCLDEMARLAIYDAIAAQRFPSKISRTGVVWQIPHIIKHPESIIFYDNDRTMEIRYEKTSTIRLALIDNLKNWDRDIVGQIFTEEQFIHTFDYYLHRVHGHGPLRVDLEKQKSFHYLTGYNRDPGGLFSGLRHFLPKRQCIISQDGEVYYDELHYLHPLLKYWANSSVTLQKSEYTDSTAWINIDGEILCEAKARELRRKDGSYHQYRLR